MASEEKAIDQTLASAVRAMEDLVDEAVQVYEMDKERINVVDDLYNSLKIITTFLSFSVDVNPRFLNLPDDVRCILTPSLDILIIRANARSENRRFDQLTLDETTSILSYSIPLVMIMARADREIKTKKISFLKEGARRLKRIPSASQDNTMSQDNSMSQDASMQMEKVEGQ